MIAWPSTQNLGEELSKLLRDDHPTGVTIVDRQMNAYASTFPSEIVTCRASDGSLLKLLCKCVTHLDTFNPQLAELPYEIQVYKHVLAPLPLTTPRFYGAWDHDPAGAAWLVIEYLDPSQRVTHVEEPEASVEAAAIWLGRFHALNEPRTPQPELSFLNRFDLQHYQGKLERMQMITRGLITSYPWLSHLLEGFGQVIHILLDAKQTVIHGQYYPDNILYWEGRVYPVDWETAAVAAGVIDIASLTENWPQRAVERYKDAYLQARYGGAPSDQDFECHLAAARCYLQVHWLGHEADPLRPKWTRRTSGAWRFDQLYQAGRQLGIL